MGVLDFLRRRRSVCDVQGLGAFIDGRAAFLVQKGMYEYSRARSGHYAKVLMSEPAFMAAMDRSRWSAFPLGLAMVAEAAEGVLTVQGGPPRGEIVDGLRALVLDLFDRYQRPGGIDQSTWLELREELAQRLAQIGLHARKHVKDIPLPFVERYFNLVPIDAALRKPDFDAIRNYLRVSLVNIHDDLARSIDVRAVAAALAARTERARPVTRG